MEQKREPVNFATPADDNASTIISETAVGRGAIEHIAPGAAFPVLECAAGRMAMLICKDLLLLPEKPVRQCEIDLLLVSAMTPSMKGKFKACADQYANNLQAGMLVSNNGWQVDRTKRARDEHALISFPSGYDHIVPLSSFIVVDDCIAYTKKIKSDKTAISICFKHPKEAKGNVSIQQTSNFGAFNLYTANRDIQIQNLEFGQEQDTQDLVITLKIGRSSPYIEVLDLGHRMILLNGLHRLYSIHKANRSHVEIPCVVLHLDDPMQRIKEHPYENNLAHDPSPPVLSDFFRDSLTYDFPLRSGRKHIQILTNESIIPD